MKVTDGAGALDLTKYKLKPPKTNTDVILVLDRCLMLAEQLRNVTGRIFSVTPGAILCCKT